MSITSLRFLKSWMTVKITRKNKKMVEKNTKVLYQNAKLYATTVVPAQLLPQKHITHIN